MAESESPSRYKEISSKIIKFATNHKLSFVNLLTVSIVFVIEILWNEFAFNCPCTHPESQMFGYFFIFLPAISFGLLSVLCNTSLWKFNQGRRHCICPLWSKAVLRATLPAVSWIIMVFLDGRVFSCFFVPYEESLCASSKPQSSVTTSSWTDVLEPKGNVSAKAISQIIAMFITGAYVLGALVGRACMKCCCSVGYYQHKFFRKYRIIEGSELEKVVPEKAEERAKKNVSNFIKSVNHLSEDDWKFISNLDFPHKKRFYSSLDEWSLKRQIREVKLPHENNELPNGFEFIGDAEGTYIYGIDSDLPLIVRNQVHIGDRILSVNDTNVWGASYPKIEKEMKKKPGDIRMCLQYMPESFDKLKNKIEEEKRRQQQTNTN